MNKKDVRASGFMRGWNVASWQNMQAIGDSIPIGCDYYNGDRRVTAENQIDIFIIACGDAESNDRDFSPFEFTAHDINESNNPDSMWEAFDAGINAGIAAYIRKHWNKKIMRKWNRPS